METPIITTSGELIATNGHRVKFIREMPCHEAGIRLFKLKNGYNIAFPRRQIKEIKDDMEDKIQKISSVTFTKIAVSIIKHLSKVNKLEKIDKEVYPKELQLNMKHQKIIVGWI